MPYYNKTAGQELNKPGFFLYNEFVKQNNWGKFFKQLQDMFEPEKSNDRVDVDACEMVMHNAVATVCICDRYQKRAPQDMCEALVGISERMSYGELLIRYLHNQGVKMNNRDSKNYTPIFYATRPEIIHLLRELGSMVSAKGNVGGDNLHRSVSGNVAPKTAVYLRMKEGKGAAVAALLEWKEGQDNIIEGYKVTGAFGRAIYREGGYSAYLKTDEQTGRLRVLNIEHVNQRKGYLKVSEWGRSSIQNFQSINRVHKGINRV